MQTKIFLLLLAVVACSSCKNQPIVTPEDLTSEIAAIENGLIPAIQIKGEVPKTFSISERMERYHVPGVSIAVVRAGKIRWAKGYGMANTESGTPVDTGTLLQAGSISKPLAALSVLKLVQEGKLDLDENVNTYLQDWKVPENKFTSTEKVTLRLLLTHSAGMTVHGFPGYSQTDTFPSDIDVLNGLGNTPAIFVDTFPGAIWRYSGGGYTVAERVVENVTGMPFASYLQQNILQPMRLVHSTYEQPLPADRHAEASAAYDTEGKIIEGLWHNYPEQAAAGLWTTPSDLARYCLQIQEVLAGKTDGVLSKATVEQMLTKHKNDWGLGPSLQWNGDSLLFRHGGKNAGFTNEMVAFANRGDAVIVMTNADRGGELMGEMIRALSAYYDWGISKPRIIEPIALTSEALDELTGDYLYNEQVPGVGDYLIQVLVKNGQLTVIDTNENSTNTMVPLQGQKFVDVDNGDEMVFQKKETTGSLSFLWNNRFQFTRVE